MVRKLGSKLAVTRQNCVKVRSDQTDAITKLTFTHFCLATGNLLPNFLTTVTHSFFKIMSSVIFLDKNGGSGEKNAQVKILF